MNSADGDLADKVVLVTGAAQGIGRAIAQVMAGDGAHVIAADVNDDGGRQTCELITASGGGASFLHCDVTDPASVTAAVESVLAACGRLDAAVNNAGTEGQIAPIHEYDVEAFDKVVALNLRGVFICMQAELRVMVTAGRGCIVNISSIAGFRAFAGFSAYNATKHAVVGLTRTAALEYATRGIRINSVAPGFCDTPMVTDRGLRAQPGSEDYRQLEQIHPMHRLGRPEEIAKAVAWLCADAASFTTGHNLAVDGGYLAK